jgi:hypothetical protein
MVFYKIKIRYVGFNYSKSLIAFMMGKVFPAAVGKVIQNRYVAALIKQPVNHMASDEPATTRNYRFIDV